MASFLKIDIRPLALLIVFCGIGAVCYLAATFDTFPGDEYGLRMLLGFRSPWLDIAAFAASSLAQPWVVFVSVPALSLAFWLVRRRADAVVILLILLPDGINQGLKHLVDRPRPEFSWLASPPEGPAFPSGHSVHAFLLFGLLIVILGTLVRPRWLRITIQVLLGLMILAVGASRVYMGIHWPSDVLGAYLVGGVSMVVLFWVREKLINQGLQ